LHRTLAALFAQEPGRTSQRFQDEKLFLEQISRNQLDSLISALKAVLGGTYSAQESQQTNFEAKTKNGVYHTKESMKALSLARSIEQYWLPK
jgi:hypothetical protein